MRLERRAILIVDDELAIRSGVQQRFVEEGAEADTADSLASAREKLASQTYDLLVLDHRLPDGTGLAFLEGLRESGFDAAVIMMTAFASPEDAVRAMKAGALDYLTKPFDLEDMILTAVRALETATLRRELRRRRKSEQSEAALDRIVGDHAAMVDLRDHVQRVAESGASTVLITGESGTGKNVVARAIHYAGPSADCPFLEITCTALPEQLLESELFGHEKGAFTDAKRAKRGLLEEADGGTVFLDEIGDLPLSLQGKLLRFLEDRRFRRVGGLRDLQVDVRVIAATNRDLQGAIADGRFRSDLYYRLNVIPVEVPPLREHLDDLEPLARHFCVAFARDFHRPERHFDRAALNLMKQHSWPGNVRELRNCVERAVLLSRGDEFGANDLPPDLRATGAEPTATSAPLTLPAEGLVFDDMVRGLLDQALERTGGNKSRAAELLGIHRDNVRYWVRKYGLTRWVRSKASAAAENKKEGPAESAKEA